MPSQGRASASVEPRQTPPLPDRVSAWPPIAIFAALALAIACTGYLMFEHERAVIKQAKQDSLAAIADLKARQVAHWIAERRGDAQALSQESFLAAAVHDWLRRGGPPDETSRRIRVRLTSLKQAYHYRSVLLLDMRGALRLSADGSPFIGAHLRDMALEALRTRTVMLSDLHWADERAQGDWEIELGLCAPLLFTPADETPLAGVLLLKVDPKQFLYPLIESWPTQSDSAETLLVRREGDEVVYLTGLRHRRNTALRLRIPLHAQLPAAMAARGQEGVVEGIDYRGVAVLAALRRIPGTPWSIIAKVDADEVYAPIHRLAWIVALSVGVIIGAAGVATMLWWWQQRAHDLVRQYRSELARQALVRRFDYLAKYANDIILLMDEEGRILEANDRALSAYGYTREELLQLHGQELHALGAPCSLETQPPGSETASVFETVHRRKDGTPFPVEVSARSIEVKGKRFRQAIVRDITERKRAQEQITEFAARMERQACMLDTLLSAIPDQVYLLDREGCIRYASAAVLRTLGLETADVIGKTGRELGMPVEVLERCARERERVFAGVATRGETSFSTPDGIREFEYIANPLRGPNDTVEAIVLSVRDMTERNRVACQIARLKDMYAILSETNQAIMRAQDQDALFREVCRIAVDHGHFELAWIGLVDAETGLIRAAVSSGPAAPSLSTVRVCIDANHPEGRGPMGTAVREGSYRICNDFLGDPNTKPWHEPAVRFGIRSSAAFPLYCQGQVIGAFSLYAGEKDFFDAELTSLLQEMAMDIAYALDNFAREEQRRRAETALLSVKGQLQHLLSVSPAVIYSAKPDGDYRTTFIGEGIHGCLGYSPQELLDTPRFWPDQVHPEDRPRIFAELPHLLETGHHTYEYRFRHQDGTYRWLHDEVRLVRDGAGNPLEIVGCLFDITERRKTEEALRNALAEQRAIFEAALMGIALTQDRRMVRVNRRMLEITGYSREELEGSSTEFLYASRPLFEKVGQEGYPLLAQGKNYDTETQFRRKDGSVIWVRLSGRMIDLSAPVSGSLWVIDDITARKSAEERLLLWAKLLEGSTQAITITDAYNHILMVNRAFTEVTGYTLEEVRGKNPRLLKSGRHDLAFYREMWMALKEIGHWQGEIWNRRKNGEVYPEWLSISTVRNPQGNLTHYIGIFSDITERRAADERIHYLAHYDSLTGLPNRALLNARLEQVIAAAHRCGRHAAVLFLDLDRFKNINDSLGHPIGDLLLQAVGARLKGDLRESDIASRIGGDEFIIVLPDLGAAEDAAVAARHLFDTLSKPFSISGHELSVTASIGISVFPQHGQDVESLIKNADAALYHAKNTGRNNYQFYTEDMNARALEILALENELRRALRREEFVLYYQPQADIHSGQIVGAEALIRWQHPDRGLVGPNTFIPLAEERGLIVPLGNWVLYSACQQNRRWQTEVSRAIPVAVNISALQFRQREFLGKVTDVLRETGLDPCYLELELTESILMHDAEAAIAMVRALKAMGVKLSIDDFGTGYSSLSYLQRFPIDRLKIDGSFVRDMTTHPDAAAITQITISLAKSLNLKVIAEGVKTLEQVELLRAQGCDEVQGYYLSRPLPADEFTQLLKEGRNSSPKTPRSAKNQAESKMG